MKLKPQKIRLKITGNCNKSCFFCHQEGGMSNIFDFKCDKEFQKCLTDFKKEIGIDEVILTGGEPTLNPELEKMCKWFNNNDFKVNLTTNGSIIKDWKNIPLNKVTISIQSMFPEKILKIETKKRSIKWAERIIGNSIKNIKLLIKCGKKVRVNIVAINEDILEEIKEISKIDKDIDIRILDNLSDSKNSNRIIDNLIKKLGAKKVREYRRVISSSRTIHYTSDLINFSIKRIYNEFLNFICDKCPMKKYCYEKFYGIRLEKKESEYFVRLCLYRNDRGVLMPYKEFLGSELKKEYLKQI